MAERPRERLLNQGAAALSNAELLAIFLRTGTLGKTALDLARALLSEFGSLRGLFEASQQQLCQHLGLGKAKYAELKALLEISRRYSQETVQRGTCLQSAADTCLFLTSHLRDYKHEVFACLFLDCRRRVICFEELFHGSIHSAFVHPREVVKRALHHNASAVILTHNHPSGVAEPSDADFETTEKLKTALALVEVHVLDHIIIGEGEWISFAERGCL
jgi:DNA repair protein RadC